MDLQRAVTLSPTNPIMSIFPKSGGKPKRTLRQAGKGPLLRVLSDEGWWSISKYTIFDNDLVVTEIPEQLVSDKSGTIVVEGRDFSFDSEGWWPKRYFLTGDDLAAAAKDTFSLGSSFSIMIKGVDQEFAFKPESPFRRKLVLYIGDQARGTLAPGGHFKEEMMIAELPSEMPLPVRIFLIWLVLVAWSEQDAAPP